MGALKRRRHDPGRPILRSQQKPRSSYPRVKFPWMSGIAKDPGEQYPSCGDVTTRCLYGPAMA